MTEGAAGADAKRVVRARMREVRAAVAADPVDRARRSASICDQLIASIEPRLSSVGRLSLLLFEALSGEPDLAVLAEWCTANHVVTYVPVVDGDALTRRTWRRRPGGARCGRRPRPGLHRPWRPARPGRRPLRSISPPTARRLPAHRCGLSRTARRRVADRWPRRRRRRRDHRLTLRTTCGCRKHEVPTNRAHIGAPCRDFHQQRSGIGWPTPNIAARY